MMSEKSVELLLEKVRKREGDFKVYNEVFRMGYLSALIDVLEKERPKIRPASTKRGD